MRSGGWSAAADKLQAVYDLGTGDAKAALPSLQGLSGEKLMEVITYTVPPEEDGVCVRHILKARLHFSTHAVARLTRAENGIRVNGIHARTVDPVHAGDVVAVRSDDLRPPKAPAHAGKLAPAHRL